MDFLTKVLAAMFGRILADDLKAWCPSVTQHLIKLAVRKLPEQMQERYAEEWRAHIAEIPGEIGKLFCTVGLVWASWRVCPLRGANESCAEEITNVEDLMFKPPMRPIMRPVMWETDHGIRVGEPFLYEVEYSPEKIVQIIYHRNRGADGRVCRCWQLRPIDGGICGKWTGKFSSAEEAYDLLAG